MQAIVEVGREAGVDAPELTGEEMDAMFNFKVLDGQPDKIEGTLARYVKQLMNGIFDEFHVLFLIT